MNSDKPKSPEALTGNFTFAEYATQARKTAQFKLKDPLLYCLMGLTGEAGEVIEKAKKLARVNGTYDLSDVLLSEDKINLTRELGDVLWYLTITAELIGSSLAEVAMANNLKLADRAERQVIVGDGDDR